MSLAKLLNGNSPIGAYFQSWSSGWSSSATTLDLTNLSNLVNIVFLSFAKPNLTYTSGSNSFSNTGLEFSSDFSIIKQSISLLKQRGVVVMISVGGATYPWDSYNIPALKALITDLGAHGLDIDWEPSGGASGGSQLGPIISALRSGLGSNVLISLAGFSVGAYGKGAFANSTPASTNTGMCIPGLTSNGSQLDFINLMSYDASPVYDPTVGFSSYRTLFNGPILIGCEVPPEAWGGNIITLSQVTSYCQFAMKDAKTNGLFVWSYQKSGTPSCANIIKTASDVFNNTVITPVTTPIVTPVVAPVVSSETWKAGMQYNTGMIIKYNTLTYKCLQSHNSQVGWEPGVANTLWSVVSTLPIIPIVPVVAPVVPVVTPVVPVVTNPLTTFNVTFTIDTNGVITNLKSVKN